VLDMSPSPTPIHLVLGDSAAGCVRAACAACGLPGAVVGFADDLAQGPLSDAQARAAYFRAQPVGDGMAVADGDAPFLQWPALIDRLDLDCPDALIVWGGENVADTIFTAMACDRLTGRPELLLRIRVPEIDGRPYVAMYPPEQLARLYATRRPLSAADRVVLAQDFARIRDTCGPVRRLEQGRVVGVPSDYYDHLLLAACGPDWRPSGSVVGWAMAQCDGRNLLGDGFLSARLSYLVQIGRIEASGPCTTLRDDAVRLARRS
ncbi:MAG TPA: DUF3658 domain-containing protein, partial [Lamprocystis sp. (in: g-proteobacteria)]|nr:DUF3658 domain-containing protein [Lamprocystis sp. (in: g-proteobacteria)]